MEKSDLEETKRSLALLKKMEAGERRFLTPSKELREEEWNARIFEEEYIDKFPVFKRPTVAEFANAAKAFLNIYMTGEIGSVDYEKVLLTLFGGMKIGTDYLGAEKFHSSVDDESPKSLHVDEASIIKDLEPRFSPSVGRGATARGVRNRAASSVRITTVDEAKKWYMTLMNLLSKQIPDSSESEDDRETRQGKERIELAANYVGLLALKTMRIIVKNRAQTVAHIIQRQNDHFSSLWGEVPMYETPPPPHLHFLDRANPFVKRFPGSGIRLLTYLIGSFQSDAVSYRRRVLRACIMLPLYQVTTRGINWLDRAAESLHWEIPTMIKCFEDEMGSAVEDKIRNIRDFFLNRDVNEKSWVWARLFRSRALLSVSRRRLPIVSAVCAAIVHGHDPSNFIWKTAQFEEVVKDDKKFKFALRKGRIITKKRNLELIMEMVPATPEAEKLLSIVKSECLRGAEFLCRDPWSFAEDERPDFDPIAKSRYS